MPRARRIVAIDYDASIGHRLGAAFPEPEYEFHWFADSREALARIHGIRPDLIVCDLMLPGIDGRAVLDTVKLSPTLRNVPVLVLSGVRSEAVIRATLDAGAQAFLVKPCPVAKLKRTIDAILDGGDGAGEPPSDAQAPEEQAETPRATMAERPDTPRANVSHSDRTTAAPEAPSVSEGRVTRLDLDGKSFQIRTTAEGEPDAVVLTTTVVCDGRELRRAESRLACEDEKALKEQLDAQHARAVEATRRLHAQGRLVASPSGPQAAPAEVAPENPPAPAQSRKTGTGRRSARRSEVRVSEPAADVPRRASRPRGVSRRRSPPEILTPGTVFLRPAEMNEPAAPEAELVVPYREPEAQPELEPIPPPPPAPPALDTLLLETTQAPASTDEEDILSEDGWSPTKRTPWHYIPRAAAAILGVGILAILLEGPSSDEPPQAAAASPESATSAPAPSVLPPGALVEPPSARPSATASVAPSPVASPVVPATAPRATPSASPAAQTGAPPAEGEPAAPRSVEPAQATAADRSVAMAQGRLQWAQALFDQGRYDDARTALAEVFKLAPSDAQAGELAARLDGAEAAAAASASSDSSTPPGEGLPAASTSSPTDSAGTPAASGSPPPVGENAPVGNDNVLEADHQSVLALLGRYETAIDQADVASLKAIWPSADAEQVLERWKTLRSWHVALRLLDLAVTGDAAVALCVSFDEMVTADGEKIENKSRLTFHLRRSNGAWVIESLE